MKIEKAVDPELVCLDDDVNGYIKDTTETPQYLSNIAALPGRSFQRILWMQQVEAAKKKKRGVRWHSLIICWCLYWRHRSSGAYEALRNSRCIVLPSQRTLRDYTHFFKELVEFSVEVDRMLMEAVHVETCPEREKLVVLLMDEMYIREDIVYEKHSGKMIGFSNAR
eukprot:Em0007g504a